MGGTHVEVFVEAGDEVAGLPGACGASDEAAVWLQWHRSSSHSPSGDPAMHPMHFQLSNECLLALRATLHGAHQPENGVAHVHLHAHMSHC